MSYDLTQSLVMLSYAAGRAEKVWGTEAEIADFFNMALGHGGTWQGGYGMPPREGRWRVTGFMDTIGPNLIGGDWSIVWGPAVYAVQSEGEDKPTLANGMFVAYSAQNDMYVVSIAGTNFASIYVQAVEDFNLSSNQMVDTPLNIDAGSTIESQFTRAVANKSQIGTGTAIGAHISCTRLVHGGRTILQFLDSIDPGADTQLVFAGHSLGGTLAPVVARTLRGRLKSAWNRAGIRVMAIAGASPGNNRFAAEWTGDFPKWTYPGAAANNHFKHLNMLYWNEFDPVPYGWDHIDEWYGWSEAAPNQMRTILGTLRDDKCRLIAARYKDQSDRGKACGMRRLHEATKISGRWPVHYWDQNGAQAAYTNPGVFNSYLEYMFGVGMSHMGQYLDRAGIDPYDIRPFVQPA